MKPNFFTSIKLENSFSGLPCITLYHFYLCDTNLSNIKIHSISYVKDLEFITQSFRLTSYSVY